MKIISLTLALLILYLIPLTILKKIKTKGLSKDLHDAIEQNLQFLNIQEKTKGCR